MVRNAPLKWYEMHLLVVELPVLKIKNDAFTEGSGLGMSIAFKG